MRKKNKTNSDDSLNITFPSAFWITHFWNATKGFEREPRLSEADSACIIVYFQQLLARLAQQADQALYLVGIKSEQEHLAIWQAGALRERNDPLSSPTVLSTTH